MFFTETQAFLEQSILGVEIQIVDLGTYLSIVWLLMALCSLITVNVSSLSTIAQHGKCSMKSSTNRDSIDSLFYVPKSMFSHFYPLGLVLSISILAFNTFILHDYSSFVSLILFCIHCGRRWWECLFMTEYGDSKMHIAGYIVGMTHYILVPLSLEVASIESKSYNHHLQRHLRRHFLVLLISLCLFCGGNYLQFVSHHILYKLKVNITKKSDDASPNYTLPVGGGFEYCCCPHYFAEIVIYVTFVVLESRTVVTWALLIWVITNLSVVAYQQYSWYLDHCFDAMEAKQLKVIFPFVW